MMPRSKGAGAKDVIVDDKSQLAGAIQGQGGDVDALI